MHDIRAVRANKDAFDAATCRAGETRRLCSDSGGFHPPYAFGSSQRADGVAKLCLRLAPPPLPI